MGKKHRNQSKSFNHKKQVREDRELSREIHSCAKKLLNIGKRVVKGQEGPLKLLKKRMVKLNQDI